MDRGIEWHDRIPIYIFNGDSDGAFDNVKPDTIAAALKAAELHPRIIAAMMSEMVGLQCCPKLAGVKLDEPVVFNRCARQGGAESAFQWNAVMFMCLSEVVPLWSESGYGVELAEGRRNTHAVWADNIWLLSHNREELQKMIHSLTGVLMHVDLHWKPDSL